jgi:glycerol-3-phosphate acyltransferase PlsY
VAAAALPIAATMTARPNVKTFSVVVAALVVIRHRDNLVRLVRGTESKLGGSAAT